MSKKDNKVEKSQGEKIEKIIETKFQGEKV